MCRAVERVDEVLRWEKGCKTVVPEVSVGPGADGVGSSGVEPTGIEVAG